MTLGFLGLSWAEFRVPWAPNLKLGFEVLGFKGLGFKGLGI